MRSHGEVIREVVREVQVPVEVPVPAPAPAAGGGQTAALGPAGVCTRGTGPGGAGHGQLWRRGDCRRQHPRYAPLRGARHCRRARRHQARIFSTCLEPQLVSPAFTAPPKTELPADVRGNQVRYALTVKSCSSNRSRHRFFDSYPQDEQRKDPQNMAKIVVVTSGKGAWARPPPVPRSHRAWPGRPQDRRHRLRRRPAQPRPHHGLRAPRGV